MRARAPSELRLATSRTETARSPLPRPQPLHLWLEPPGGLLDVYLGPPARAPASPTFPGHTVDLPFADVALQLQLACADAEATVLLTVDLGADTDLARIELYGNPLLPPDGAGGAPVHNLGLPRRLRAFVSEEPFRESDLHRRDERGAFYDPRFVDWRAVWGSEDFRALWGWNVLHLDAAYGRYLTLAFSGLPPFPRPEGAGAWGLDLQRLVLYPYLEDVDHRPHVEHSVLSARVAAYAAPSAYWTRHAVAAPQPEAHQAVLWDAGHDALPLPCALSGLLPHGPAGPVPLFASQPVPADPAVENRIFLVTEATADHEPLLEGVHLAFEPGEGTKYRGPKGPFAPDYLVRVHVTSDREAAYASDPGHPAWRLVAAERRVRPAGIGEAWIFFAEPVVARWVRLTVRPLAPPGADPSALVAFQLHRLDLIRCRSWLLTPGEDEDLDVEAVFIRLRGPRLLDDYAYVEGRHGLGVTVELRREDGTYERVRAFRNLLEILEETHHRVLANARRPDRPVQRWREVSDVSSTSRSRSTQRTAGAQRAVVRPQDRNRQVVRSGTLTEYVRSPRHNLGEAPFTGLPDAETAGLVTERTFEGSLDDVPPPSLDLGQLDAQAIFTAMVEWGAELASRGLPVSVGLGGNVGAGGGLSAGVVGTFNGGISVNAGTQLGGGVTRSETTGDQGSVTRSETWTVSSEQRQRLRSASFVRGRQSSRGRDERTVTREELSTEERRTGLEVRYGGAYEDLVLVTVPVGRRLQGGAVARTYADPTPRTSREALRVRVDYLPRGVRMDVEFRGRATPRAGRR